MEHLIPGRARILSQLLGNAFLEGFRPGGGLRRSLEFRQRLFHELLGFAQCDMGGV